MVLRFAKISEFTFKFIDLLWQTELFNYHTTLEISLASTSTENISASRNARQLFKKRKKTITKNLQNESNLVPVTLIVQK